MPSLCFTASEKAIIKNVLPNNYHKILAAAVCRIYYAYPDPKKWTYTGLSGALAFGRSNSSPSGNFWFKLVDISGTKGVIWEHEIYEDGSGHPGKGHFGYHQERTFWHTFQGDDCMIAFVFVNEDEASGIYKKVLNRSKYISKGSKRVSKIFNVAAPIAPAPQLTTIDKKKEIDINTISAPTGFKRVAHMGYDSENGFTTENVDPSWAKLLESLTNMGFSMDEINESQSFIKDYVQQAGGIDEVLSSQNNTSSPRPTARFKNTPPPPPASRIPTQPTSPQQIKRVKPPAPPAPIRRPDALNVNESTPTPSPRTPASPLPNVLQSIPPPSRAPPSASGPTAGPSRPPPNPTVPAAAPSRPPPNPSVPASAPSRPPPPPATTATAPPTRPPPPASTSTTSAPSRPPPALSQPAPATTPIFAPPPPPPPAPPAPTKSAPVAPPAPPPPQPKNAPPAPPQAPPASSSAAPPPPPPPPSGPPPGMGLGGGRADLLASIQGKGIHALKKTPQGSVVASGGGLEPDPLTLQSSTRSVSAPVGEQTSSGTNGGGGDLAASLAAALNKRKGTMGDDSEEEANSDDEWD